MGPAAAIVLSLSACFLLPERYAFNAPVSNLLFGTTVDSPAESVLDGRIHVVEGFSVGFFATGIRNAHFLRLRRAATCW